MAQRDSAKATHAVDVTLHGNGTTETATTHFDWTADPNDAERLRWYLEDYLEYPVPPAPTLAANAETRLAQQGVDLFNAVFTGDAANLWARLQNNLGQTRIEISVDPDQISLPWELLRDPRTNTPIALTAAAYVHTHHNPARQPTLADPESDGVLRVLLVICRPGGRNDVPFRSVARRLTNQPSTAGFELDVLRPATYPALAATLTNTHRQGRPYHVVHFDGHGTWANLNTNTGDDDDNPGAEAEAPLSVNRDQYMVLSPPRPGHHGYLAFENPGETGNTTYVDGPALGTLLATTGVPVLVLNACRSAHTDTTTTTADTHDDAALVADVHSRIRAYGSLAQEVADAGVPGVVAMAYNVYVVTATAFVNDLYTHLLTGHSLGAAVTQARKALAADPARTIAYKPVPLQDWVVPVAYETAALTLFTPKPTPTLNIDNDTRVVGLPASATPDIGFYGRDDTLLALDRAYDTQPVVVLHALAGAGKTATAAEFARWYTRTGGATTVLWSSFEQPVTLPRLLDQLADHLNPVLTAKNIQWQALPEPQRLAIAVQLLAAIPVLWVWDNVEGVAGFPPGTPSAWTTTEQTELRDFLADIAGTGSKVLLTSRTAERAWLGELPARIALTPMPMRESVELAAAIAQKHGRRIDDIEDWRPLLAYAAGNPLTITLTVSQAFRQNLRTKTDIDHFVDRLRAGEGLDDNDQTQGRTRSLGASLRYGYTTTFTPTEQTQLAHLALFQGFADVDALVFMGHPDLPEHLPALTGITRDTWTALADRAADTGLLTALSGGYYQLHPALPWFLTPTLTDAHGPPGSAGHNTVLRAYTAAVAALGNHYAAAYERGVNTVIGVLAAEEPNLLHARRLAIANNWPQQVIGPMQGLRLLYDHRGRSAEWARLVTEIIPIYTNPDSDGPLPDREQEWTIVTQYRVRMARSTRDWTFAEHLQTIAVAVDRRLAGPSWLLVDRCLGVFQDFF